MASLFTIVMLVLSSVIIFYCVAQRRVPSGLFEWVVLIVTAFLIISNVR